jgi:3-hydroxymyristoyl/3-hydroxydecanoyl-(acyl carrier protein) dehydratase
MTASSGSSPLVEAIERQGDSALLCRLLVPHDLAIFSGHFPAMPIVPGVMQIGWAVDLARAHLGAHGRFKGIRTAKFRRIVRPGMQLELALDLRRKAGLLHFDYRLRGSTVTSGGVLLEDDHG